MRTAGVLLALVAIAAPLTVPARGQNVPDPVPGAHITNGSIPWAVDVYDGKQELVPIHHTTVDVDNHRGRNVAGSLAGGFFYKPKMTTEIAGTHARVALHTGKPVFYVHVMSDPGGDSTGGLFDHWAIVRAVVKKDHRVISQIKFTQLTGKAKRDDSQVDTTVATLKDGWLKITPVDPLANGEYALLPVTSVANTFSTVVFDFTIDPNGPNAPDAVAGDAK